MFIEHPNIAAAMVQFAHDHGISPTISAAMIAAGEGNPSLDGPSSLNLIGRLWRRLPWQRQPPSPNEHLCAPVPAVPAQALASPVNAMAAAIGASVAISLEMAMLPSRIALGFFAPISLAGRGSDA